ncbi:MAG: efflux RND transporter periplasmic adaptor subunit [Bacteroidales bacterium]|nr:efflux RND transporter periplasmic adaptor subunit [Bacteroidales bacterium]HNW73641.1 efflux RND transporter periplasmic adaptor subunit [Bacteroidales bacterium]HPS49942.1 efflux RND transporter periplasmic adaptor subunit [Bacteroidales bacterium]
MNRKKYTYIIASVAILIIIAWVLLSKNDKNQQVVAKVKKGNFPIEVTTTGELVAKSSEKIYGPQGLRQIQIWQVKIQDIIPDGTVVDSGQYVASLDRTEISNKIKDEETNLEKLESQLTKTRLDTSLELRSARDELINLKYALEERKITLDQSKYEPPATIRQVQIDLEKSQRAFEQAEKNYKLRYQKAVANMQEVSASYNQAQRKLQQMTDVLKEFNVLAPKAGMVIYKRNWDGNKMGVGATVNAWDNVVAELPDLSEMISKTYINEIDISKVKVGQAVQVGIDAFPEKKFTGKVIEVANIGEQLQNSNAKVYEVRILVNEFDSILRPAMTTKNKILTSVVDSVFFIPIEAIFNADSVAFVYRKDGSSAVKQQVIVGQSNDNEIIIRAGLTTDDEVLLVPPEKADKLKLKKLPADIIAKFREKPSKPKTEKTANRPSGTQTPGTPVIMKK